MTLVLCDRCRASVPATQAREQVVLYARTIGAGGTLSNVKQQRRTGLWLCDACMRAAEHGNTGDLFAQEKDAPADTRASGAGVHPHSKATPA